MNPAAALRDVIAIAHALRGEIHKFMWTWTVMHNGAEAAERWRDR